MDNQLRIAIVAAYEEYRVPADRIVCDPAVGQEFIALVSQHLPAGYVLPDLQEMNHMLHNLRRRGQANGGLPRLFRRYRGRSVS